MQEYVRCKACGYITEAGKAKGICPACGVPHTAFEPYKLTISEKRRKMMDLHIHPIIVHIPQAFGIIGLILMLLIPFSSDPFKSTITEGAKVILTILPLSVMFAFLSGLYDAKLRFKKVTTPILRKKIGLGVGFIIFSIVCAVFIQSSEITSTIITLEVLSLLLCNICAAGLGKLGASLLDSKLPG
jgi:uncharacterized membrane protein